ncbi:sulfite exporter TauE/SafE family protein [Adhaeribacter rhizoryzae]|uniref:Probable membrane transporter protein n=1 Tax=Adhaeribacter rhizoryzae TaxID=2607907 RepID=A0A5M6D205_9BACT|nr:TSUP family transporter [Adhaeribacter rhizoryzae]KAA5540322.1 TSUP family transporter [Adhaeribacter rhizoryzae]
MDTALTTDLVFLCFFAFLAGFIDSIVGGGGLIQTPAMLVFLPHVPIPTLFGTGKVSGIAGTTSALLQYGRSVKINWPSILPAAVAAFIFSFIGARAVSHIPTEALRPVVLVLLVSVAIYTFIKKDLGALHAPKLAPAREKLYAVLLGVAIGFYDGFFGPGTGSFLIFAFVGLFGFSFLAASASAKLVNVATNLSALAYFAYTGQILYHIGIPMAVCNILGSQVGARLAIAKGSGFVRIFFLIIVSAIIFKFAYDSFLK